MISFPPCKINLGLDIIEKRADGYHNLETVFYPLPFTDILEIIRAEKISFTSTGNTIPGDGKDNLCLRAYHLLAKDFALSPVAIHLHKIIPTGAGLGGGSSDAAHTLLLLNTIFELKLSADQLRHYAQQLGSDCAFFVEDAVMLGTGRGEILQPIDVDLKGKFLVLLKPVVHVSTADAYKGVKPATPIVHIREIIQHKALADWRHSLKNDFETSVFHAHPIIKSYKENLYNLGALYASMSGSGSAVFGIFDKPVNYEGPDLIWSGTLTR